MTEVKDRQREKALSDAHVLKAQQVAERFERLLPRARTDFTVMKEYTMKFSVDKEERKSWLNTIGKYDRQGKFPFEIMVSGDAYGKTLADEWEEWIRNQYAIKMMSEVSLNAIGGMFLKDPSGSFQRSLWAEDLFIQGVKGGKSGLIIGEMGAGKTDFVSEEMIQPLSKVSNMLVVHNIALLSYNGGDMPGNIQYAATVPDALRKIVMHRLEGMDAHDQAQMVVDYEDEETGEVSSPEDIALAEATMRWLKRHPYTTAWFIDEAGFERSKHDAMSKNWKMFRNITRISRKLKCYQFTIYQFDEAPPDLRQFARHAYRKPSEEHKDIIELFIRGICPEITLKGLLGWEDRRDFGMEYIEFDTDDQASMSPDEFDTNMMLNYANVVARDAAIGSREQLNRFLQYIDIVQSRNLGVSTEEGDFFFLYRVKRFNELEIERLKAEAQDAHTARRRDELLEEAKLLGIYTRWPYLCHIAHSRYPERNFFPETLKREFKKLESKYPNIMDMDELPYEEHTKPIEESPLTDEEAAVKVARKDDIIHDEEDFFTEPADV